MGVGLMTGGRGEGSGPNLSSEKGREWTGVGQGLILMAISLLNQAHDYLRECDTQSGTKKHTCRGCGCEFTEALPVPEEVEADVPG